MNLQNDGPKKVATSDRVTTPLTRIPLWLRMLVYCTVFLGLVLGVLPWVFFQLDARFPAIHREIGPLRWAGVIFGGLCLALYLTSSWVLTYRGRGAFVEFDPPTELVISGPYRFVRNPVVAFLLGTILGEAVALSSTGVLFMFCIFLFLAQRQVTRLEEPLLRSRFGQSYVDYCQRVPRWIPRWPRDTWPPVGHGGPSRTDRPGP